MGVPDVLQLRQSESPSPSPPPSPPRAPADAHPVAAVLFSAVVIQWVTSRDNAGTWSAASSGPGAAPRQGARAARRDCMYGNGLADGVRRLGRVACGAAAQNKKSARTTRLAPGPRAEAGAATRTSSEAGTRKQGRGGRGLASDTTHGVVIFASSWPQLCWSVWEGRQRRASPLHGRTKGNEKKKKKRETKERKKRRECKSLDRKRMVQQKPRAPIHPSHRQRA